MRHSYLFQKNSHLLLLLKESKECYQKHNNLRMYNHIQLELHYYQQNHSDVCHQVYHS